MYAENLRSIKAGSLEDEWRSLKRSEAKLIELMNGDEPPDDPHDEIQNGTILYLIWTKFPFEARLLELVGMPKTDITTREYDRWKHDIEQGPGVLTSDGTLLSTVKYAAFDPGWGLAFLEYVMHRHAGFGKHPFGTRPATLSITGRDSLKIVLVSDWGTGIYPDGASLYCPAQLVQQGIQDLRPDLVIHLGDVYYAGTDIEENDKLIPLFPKGGLGSFTLNSNHEMYNGGFGYFKRALQDATFSQQKGTSYFAITFQNWIIFGLDSAYFDPSPLYSYGAVSDKDQLDFITDILQQRGNENKQIIVLTHHNPLTYDGQSINELTTADKTYNIVKDVYAALNRNNPDFWYCGHMHVGAAYNHMSAAGQLSLTRGGCSRIRCFGNGALPYGAGYGFTQRGVPATIDYHAQTAMPTEDVRQQNRIRNGFAMITLSNNQIVEQAFEVANPSGAPPTEMWTRTTSYGV